MGLNSYIAKQFSNPSGFGGKVVSAVMNRQNHPMYEETERLLSFSAADYVLDIGCGNGYVLNLFARRNPCVFTGIDISESVVKFASRRNQKFIKDGKMRFLCRNAQAISFANDSFDKAYTINTVYFWNNLERVMAEIHRVMKPGGLFINTIYSNETLDRFSHTQFGYLELLIAQHSIERFGAAPISFGTQYRFLCVLCHVFYRFL